MSPTANLIKTVIEKRKAETFAAQTWRPGCARCGVSAPCELGPSAAADWWLRHRFECAG